MTRTSSLSKTKRNILTEGAASLYPFTTEQLIDKEDFMSLYKTTILHCLLFFFNRRHLVSPHVFLAGITGAGKTATLMLTACRSRIKNIPVFILAPEKQSEYMRLTKAIGAQFINLGSSSPDRINIMEIFPVAPEVKKQLALLDGEENSSSDLLRKTTSLTDFFSMHIKTDFKNGAI